MRPPWLPSSRPPSPIATLVDLLLPALCHGCEAPLGPNPWPLCEGCLSGWPPALAACPRCGAPGPEAGGDCGSPCETCTLSPPPFERARALFLYQGPVKGAIQALKYRQARPIAPLLGGALARALPLLLPGEVPRGVVPVPTSRSQLARRGYNQAALIAQPVSEVLACPLLSQCLRRTGRRAAGQGRLDRARTLRASLEPASPLPDGLVGARLLLVDDVLTTGATARACAQVLLDLGAGAVDVLVVAQTPAPGSTAEPLP